MGAAFAAEVPTDQPAHDVFSVEVIRQPAQVKARLDAGLDPNTRNNTRHNQDHLLCYAVRFGTPETVKLLLARGAEIDAKSPHFGKTALFQAAYDGRVDMAEVLVAAKADVNALDAYGNNPLREAIVGKKPSMVKFLIEHGANPQQRNTDKQTMAELAAKFGTAPIKALFQ